MNKLILYSLFCTIHIGVLAQNWNLKLRSTVDFRTWKLSTKAQETEKPLTGAKIKLLKAGAVVKEMFTDADGTFVIDVPPNGEYILEVSYPECNTKRFSVSTFNVPDGIFTEKYNPSFGIGGFIMAKPFNGIDYSKLSEPLVFVKYDPKVKNFNKDDIVTNAGIDIVTQIAEQENTLIQTFCNFNKQGNDALVKPDCPLAKSFYNKALQTIANEEYPKEQLLKTDICLNKEKLDAQKLAEELKAKLQKDSLQKIALQNKLIDDQKNKLKKDSLDKATKENNLATQKAKQEELLKREKEAKEKLAAEKLANTKPKEVNPNPVEKPKEIESKPILEKATSVTVTSQPKSDSKHKVPQVLGVNTYKDNMTKANDFFKMKRYVEAKQAYEIALKDKPNDALAISKIKECVELIQPKK